MSMRKFFSILDLSLDLLLLDLGIHVIHGLDLLALLFSSQIVLGDLNNQRRKHQNTDQVGDHHQTVEGVGDIPSQRGGENRTKDNGAYVDDAEDEGGLCTKEVLPSLGAVVRPAQNGSEGEEEHCNGNELFTNVAPREYRVEGTANQGCVGVACGNFTGYGIEYAAVESACGENNQCGYGSLQLQH